MAMTEEEVMDLIPRASSTKVGTSISDTVNAKTTRKLLIIGCGDGGCNIGSDITEKLGEDVTYFIAYNTSKRGMFGSNANKLIIPDHEDGAGKVREFSKDVFKKNSYKVLMSNVAKVIEEEEGEFSYIIICTTTDGGTGSGISPMTAKLLADNTEIPVIVLGVYPSLQEDPTAQFNALQWQAEINKIGVPYFVLDNNQPPMGPVATHRAVNAYAALLMSLIAGKEFGNSNISMIDDRNLYMLLSHLGRRIVGAVSTVRLTSGQSLDDYVDQMLQKNFQPIPTECNGIGIFVKGPDDVIGKIDTNLTSLQAKYGTAMIKFAHIEKSDDLNIAILMTGCSEATDRLTSIKACYDDAMSQQAKKDSVVGDLVGSMSNPMGKLISKTLGEEAILDALDL